MRAALLLPAALLGIVAAPSAARGSGEGDRAGVSAAVDSAARAALRSWERPGVRLEIVVRRAELPAVPRGGRWVLERRGDRAPAGNETMDWRSFDAEGKPAAKMPVSVVVRRFEAVPIACRAIERTRILSLSDFCPEERETTALREGVLPADSLVGLRIRQTVQRGNLVLPRMVERLPLFERGASVRVVAVVGAARVEDAGHAMQPGRPGSRVRVRAASGKVLVGTVRPDGAVEIAPGRKP